MTKRKGRSYPPGVRGLLEQAAKNGASPSAPRKHHLVPASYLENWATDGRITVTDINEGRAYTTSPQKAARETDFYRIEHNDIDPDDVPPLLAETILSHLEGWATTAVSELRTSPRTMSPDLLAKFAAFLGFQFTRGQSFRRSQQTMVNDMFLLQFGGMTDYGIRERLTNAGQEPTDQNVADVKRFLAGLADGTYRVMAPDAQLVMLGFEHAEELMPRLLGRAWVVCETPRLMITSDEPVLPIEGPRGRRTQVGGIGTAGVVVFPLSPTQVLAMVHEDIAFRLGIHKWAIDRIWSDELDEIEAGQLVREIVAHTNRWTFEVPDKERISKLRIPYAPKPFSLDDPIAVEHKTKGPAQLVRAFKPNRWSTTSHPPPWPVAKWWQ